MVAAPPPENAKNFVWWGLMETKIPLVASEHKELELEPMGAWWGLSGANVGYSTPTAGTV